VVSQSDDGLLDLVADQLGLILDLQACLLHTIDRLDGRHVPKPHFNGSREALLAVLAEVLEHDALLAIPVHGRRALEVLLSPSHRAAVKGVGAVVHCQVVALAIEAVDLCARDAVCDAADILAEEGVVLGTVGLCGREAENDVGACDFELLDDAALGQEGEGVGELFLGGHDCLLVYELWGVSSSSDVGRTGETRNK
jgi:hypothetical protein